MTADATPQTDAGTAPLWDTTPLLQVEHLSMVFGGLTAIDDLSFNAAPGQITAVIGPNGAGKTTVFNCLTGFYKPTTGRLSLHKDAESEPYLLEQMTDYEITRYAGVARTFQNIRLFKRLTVLENLLVAQHVGLMKATSFGFGGLFGSGKYKRASAVATEKAKHWLERVGLIDRADFEAGNLAYGDQRRLEIARAMCTEPKLLCLDEPAAGLNPKESLDLNTLLISIRDDLGTGILLIEHDMSVVMEISDHVVVLDYGVKISDGTAAFVRDDPEVIRAYLGVDEGEAEDLVAEAAQHSDGSEGAEASP